MVASSMASWPISRNTTKLEGVDPGKVMGYYKPHTCRCMTPLAKEFLICQRWFAAHPGPTFPNRFYTLTGRLNRDAYGRFRSSTILMVTLSSRSSPGRIFDHLTEHGVSWRYYEHGYCFLRMFERYTFDDNYYIVDARRSRKGFLADVAARDACPPSSFIDPDFIDEPDGQEMTMVRLPILPQRTTSHSGGGGECCNEEPEMEQDAARHHLRRTWRVLRSCESPAVPERQFRSQALMTTVCVCRRSSFHPG